MYQSQQLRLNGAVAMTQDQSIVGFASEATFLYGAKVQLMQVVRQPLIQQTVLILPI